MDRGGTVKDIHYTKMSLSDQRIITCWTRRRDRGEKKIKYRKWYDDVTLTSDVGY